LAGSTLIECPTGETITELNIPHNTRILVATGEDAKLFRMKDDGLQNEGRWALGDQSPSGKSPPERSDKESIEATFSKIMAEKLYSDAHAGHFDKLIICADPETLGEMRPLLHQEVTDKIRAELDKTPINSSISDIERTLSNELD